MLNKNKKKYYIAVLILAVALLSLYKISPWRMFKADVQDPGQIKGEQEKNYLDLESTYLHDLAEDKVYGVAKRAYQNNIFTFIANIAGLNDGNYSVYLEAPDDRGRLLTGSAVKKNGQYLIIYEKSADLRQYSRVVVIKKNDHGQESTILEGNFK